MIRTTRLGVVAGATSLLVAGVALGVVATAGAATGPGDATGAGAPTTTAAVVRRAIQSSDLLDGTLGYSGDYAVVNRLETTGETAGAAAGSNPDQAYLAAKAQYDTAVANRDALRNPTAADVKRAKAALAQAQAVLKTAQQADDGPTAAQSAAARSAVTQAEENLDLAVAQRDAAEAALAACGDTTPPDPATSPSPGAGCDPVALAASVDRADGDVRVRRAQLKAAEAALAGLDDVQPNAATNIASARAGVAAASAALDALLDPTPAKLRQADDAVAVARAQLDASRDGLDLPTGMVTSVAAEGTVVEPGEVIYALDGNHAVVLLAGAMPAWRALEPGAADGPDIGQLERGLEALGLGFENVSPDNHWDDDTTAAVEALQESLGTTVDGSLDVGEVVFLPGAIRVTEVLAGTGSTVHEETRVLAATSTEREVAVDLAADRQSIVEVGAGVTVGLPDGTEVPGSIAEIGAVASVAAGANAEAGGDPVITVTIRLDEPGATGSLDGAPVTVSVVRERREDVLAVPVNSLLALAEGGYAVEVVDGPTQTRLVGVETGLFEDGFVEVRSTELDEGMQVVVPA